MAAARTQVEQVRDLLASVDVVDAHHHLWASRGEPEPSDFDLLGDESALPQTYLSGDFREDAGVAPVVGSVELGGYAVDDAERAGIDEGLPTVLVPAARLESEAGLRDLRAVARHPRVRGVRQILNWHRDPRLSFVDAANLMDEPAWRRGLAVLGELGLSFDLQIYPGQMARAARLAASSPATLFVLNHAGMPVGRSHEALVEWRAGMAQLARLGNVVVKLSGFGMTDHRWTSASTVPVIRETIALFGPERSMFASNFPVDRLYASYGEVIAVVAEATAELALADRREIFAGTARRVYRIDEALLAGGARP